MVSLLRTHELEQLKRDDYIEEDRNGLRCVTCGGTAKDIMEFFHLCHFKRDEKGIFCFGTKTPIYLPLEPEAISTMKNTQAEAET